MIPNILTTLRLIIIPVFAYVMLATDNVALALILFVLSGLTDVVDGFIARRFNMITDIGKVYDPLVDKLMQITVLVCLLVENIIPIWVIAIVAAKEAAMIIAGLVLYIKKIVVHSNWYGKAATVMFYAVIGLLIMFGDNMSDIVRLSMLSALTVVMILVAVGYFVKVFFGTREEICDQKTVKVQK